MISSRACRYPASDLAVRKKWAADLLAGGPNQGRPLHWLSRLAPENRVLARKALPYSLAQNLQASLGEDRQAKDPYGACALHRLRLSARPTRPVRAATHADQANLPKRTKTATIAELRDPGILRRKKQAREWELRLASCAGT
jgi:hypothetical protein